MRHANFSSSPVLHHAKQKEKRKKKRKTMRKTKEELLGEPNSRNLFHQKDGQF